MRLWTRILNEKGWAAFHWPAEHGGVDWSPLRRYLFDVELRAAGAPLLQQAAFELVGPILYTYGSEAQKARYLPAIRNADEFWCQGFSEPNAGSDLASLKTTAVRDGDHYVVNGQKTWTSEGHKADMMFALVRTDQESRPQAGISFLLIDMKAPGVTVRPIWTIDEGLSVNEVFLDNVRVPGREPGRRGEPRLVLRQVPAHQRARDERGDAAHPRRPRPAQGAGRDRAAERPAGDRRPGVRRSSWRSSRPS